VDEITDSVLPTFRVSAINPSESSVIILVIVLVLSGFESPPIESDSEAGHRPSGLLTFHPSTVAKAMVDASAL
jgi:hypothetical protein